MAVGCEIGGYGDCVAGFRGGGGLDEPRVGVGHGSGVTHQLKISSLL